MKGDFTRFTHRPEKHYTRVLKQQGRVDLDADWNEWVEIVTHLERTEAIDVIGRCGAPIHGGGFEVEETADGSNLTISRGRIYVDGILCSNEPAEPGEDASPPAEPIPIDQQEDLPGYAPDGSPPLADGVYLAYLDVWDRHVTHLEDPEIREPALGGPDTTTRTRTVCQVKLHPLGIDAAVDTLECAPYPAPPADGRLAAWAEPAEEFPNPCEVPAGAGYRGLENRLYRVEIHRGSEAGPPTFKWSRDNGSVVLPVAEGGIDDKKVTLAHLGPDKVLTVAVGDWVEVSGDETELHGQPGTLAKIVPDGIDEAKLQITLSADVSAHAGEGHLKVRRWDMGVAAAGALPLQSTVELEDGVRIGFDLGATYHTGDYWVIPARTRLGTVLWPEAEAGGSPPAPRSLRRFGIEHHYCTLALVRRKDSKWTQSRDCRPSFPPLTEIDRGCCCVTVEPGESVRDAVATVVAAGGGCVSLCQGVHRVDGPLWLHHAHDVTIAGVGTATVLRFDGVDADDLGGVVIESGERIAIEDLFMLSGDAPALVTVRHDEELRLSREIALRRLTMLNPSGVGIQLAHADGVTIEECRIVAAAGIVGLWGNAATAVGSPPDDAVRVDFEDLAVGQRFSVGDVFTSSGVEIRGEPFTWGNNQTTSGGFTEVEDGGRAGGSGHDLEVNNINLGFGLATPVASLSLAFGEYGGNENLRINGEFRNVSDLDDLDGVIVGGVGVQVTRTDDLGTLRLDEVTQPISDFAIGGQELWIDDVTFGAPSRLRQELLGDGVSRLEMRDSTIRYLRAGVLSVLSDRWRITRCDVQAPEEKVRGRLFKLDLETFGDRPAGAGAVRSRDLYAKILEVLEELLAAPGPEKGSPDAVLALLWRDCAIRWSRLGEVYAWWWIRGEARGNRIAGRRRGLSAFWLHDADWRDNRITCCYGKDLAVESFLSREDETLRLHPERSVGGPALSFAGSYQASIAGNRTRGGLGVLKLSLREALKDLADPVDLAARVYGAGSKAGREDGSELEQVLRRWLEDGAALTGLAPLIAGAQEVTDALYDLAQHEEVRAALEEQGRTPPFQQGHPGPLLASLARQLSGWLFARRQTLEQTKEPAWVRWGALLPVIALTVARNRMASHADTVLMERFLTFGGLRIEDNRLDSANGQTIRVDAWPYSANVSVVVVILRYLLDALGDVAEQVGDFGDFSANLTGDLKTSFDDFVAALGKLAAAVAKQAEDWQRRLEPSLGTDYRIAGNTLRSLDTAIESNLFELAVEGNHVTMVERPVSNAVVVETIEALAEESEHLEAVVMLAQDGDVNALAYADQAQWKDPNQVDFYLDDAQLYGRAGLEYTYDAPPAAPAAGTAPAVTETGGQKQAAVELNWATWHEDVVDDGKVYHQAV